MTLHDTISFLEGEHTFTSNFTLYVNRPLKCLPIISNKGGLAESKNIALVLKENSSSELVNILKKITKNKFLRRQKQKIFYKNNNFDIKTISKMLDKIRAEIINNQKNVYSINCDYNVFCEFIKWRDKSILISF